MNERDEREQRAEEQEKKLQTAHTALQNKFLVGLMFGSTAGIISSLLSIVILYNGNPPDTLAASFASSALLWIVSLMFFVVRMVEINNKQKEACHGRP